MRSRWFNTGTRKILRDGIPQQKKTRPCVGRWRRLVLSRRHHRLMLHDDCIKHVCLAFKFSSKLFSSLSNLIKQSQREFVRGSFGKSLESFVVWCSYTHTLSFQHIEWNDEKIRFPGKLGKVFLLFFLMLADIWGNKAGVVASSSPNGLFIIALLLWLPMTL